MENAIYKTRVTANGGREGRVISENGVIDMKVEIPKELGGKGGNFTNPEQLFAAGYAACFDSALNLVARMQKIKITSEITAEVGISKTETGAFQLSVDLYGKIEGTDKETALQLLNKAHEVCPYSNATRGNIVVKLHLED